MDNVLREPGSSNTRVVNTSGIEKQGQNNPLNFKNSLGQFILIDWLQFTIKYEKDYFDGYSVYDINKLIENKVYRLFKELFNIDSQDLKFDNKGHNGYGASYSYENIYMYISSDYRMGINIKMSGQGCRDFERLGFNFVDLFKKLKGYIVNYNRIDIAIDDFSNNYFDLKKILDYLKQGLVVSKFRTYYHMYKGVVEDKSSLGDTVQFGSKASNVQITFYDKLLERKNANVEVREDIQSWVRTELRFRDEKALEMIDKILTEKNFNLIIKSVLKNYITFVEENTYDHNKSRWKTVKWWNEYLENVNKLRLTSYTIETNICRKKEWLNESVSRTQAMVYFSVLDNMKLDGHSVDYILEQLKLGSSKIDKKDLQVINDYRIQNKLNPITLDEIKDYIRDIQDVIVLGGAVD